MKQIINTYLNYIHEEYIQESIPRKIKIIEDEIKHNMKLLKMYKDARQESANRIRESEKWMKNFEAQTDGLYQKLRDKFNVDLQGIKTDNTVIRKRILDRKERIKQHRETINWYRKEIHKYDQKIANLLKEISKRKSYIRNLKITGIVAGAAITGTYLYNKYKDKKKETNK